VNNSTKRFAATIFMVLALALIFVGCSTDNSMSPTVQNTGLVVQSTNGPDTLLKMAPSSLAKGEGATYTSQFVTAAAGGQVAVGNTELGWSKVTFNPGDLPQDLTITMSWGGDEYCEGIFTPHGTVFNDDVKVELSYKTADLTGINEDDLQIYYYNASTQIWEQIGGTVDKTNKVIKATLAHFSRYAIVKT
jgi:hypothetical protein